MSAPTGLPGLSTVFKEFQSDSHDILAQPMGCSGCSLQELLKLCLEGDELVWREFLHRTQPVVSGAVRRACYGYRLDPSRYSDDLVQDVYVKLVKDECAHLRTMASFCDAGIRGYLRTMASNTTADLSRKLRAENPIQVDETHRELPDPKITIANTNRGLVISRVRLVLSQIVRGPNAARDLAVFWLHYRDGLTAGQIAGLPGIGLTESGVESLLRRLIRALRDKMR